MLKFYAHTGISFVLCDTTCELDELRETAARYLSGRRHADYDVITLEAGREWELTSPADREGIAIDDTSGLLVLYPPVFEVEDEEEAWDACAA